MASTALDYSAGRPTGAAVKAARHVGVVRYVGTPGRTKNITKAEYQDMDRNGIGVALVYENRAGDAAGGWNAGVNAAKLARADADSVGFPRDRPIYFAVDSDQVTAANFAAVSAYLDGAASVLGTIARVGVYGEYDVIEKNVGTHARYGWQTAAWSGGKRSSKAHLFQRLGQIYVGGIQVDVNEILAADWGQHNAQENEDMPLTQADAATIFWGTPFDGTDNFAQYLKGHVTKLEAGQAGILAALQAATKDPTITLDAMRQIVNDAVAQHVVITGEVHIGPASAA
jgi:hypothetical protein